MSAAATLPAGIRVFERGWLSANNIVLTADGAPSAVVDTGYWTHSDQTVALVRQALGGRSLDFVLSTHLHSDHCGGNAALRAAYPESRTLIPPGHAAFVRKWDAEALTYTPTGQHCPEFSFDALLQPGYELNVGGRRWQIHAAPGHDQHSVILFEPTSRTLISADALWENGFGVVFAELEGERAFEEVGATLDVIEQLDPLIVIPGHGRVFTELPLAMARARSRLESFVQSPVKHAAHAAKVLLKFKLLELQQVSLAEMRAWSGATRYLRAVHARHFSSTPFEAWFDEMVAQLVRSNAARLDGATLFNA